MLLNFKSAFSYIMIYFIYKMSVTDDRKCVILLDITVRNIVYHHSVHYLIFGRVAFEKLLRILQSSFS